MRWPAVLASWDVGSSHSGPGAWLFLVSNALWVRGVCMPMHALVVLQPCLAAMNIRVARKSDAG